MSDERRPDGDDRPRGGSRPRYTPASTNSRRDDRPRGAGHRDGDRKPYPKRDGEKRPYEKRDGERRPYEKRDGDRKSYPKRDGEKRPYEKRDGDRKPYGQRDGERRPYEKRDGDRKPYPKRDGEKRPYEKRDGDRKPYGQRDGERRPYEKRDGERRPYEKRDGDRKPYGQRDGERRASRPPQSSERRASRGPEIPEDVTARDLPGSARNELKTLSAENAEQVARHLVMAARLIDDDPAAAHEHALAASQRAGRVAVVRETVAITAYAVGDFALALRELRTHRRISGSDEQIALIVDSERGVGRPDRALEAGRGVDRAALPIEVRVELAIAMSGARLDLGESERALQELDIPELDPDRAFSWSPALFAARAAVLEELGRDGEAAQWRRRAEVAAEALGAVDADLEVIEIDEVEEIAFPEDDDAAPEDAEPVDAESEPAADPSQPEDGPAPDDAH
ncbi:primosomal protein [Microbacterium telephonicum]|uniref:Primosomal protein n=1 Tax=Microbacterium telephonicum TaxID=1714841 RepID=A0A498C6J0_9MICO|nr:primosomal protein [Microbacterium telephonicum]RLK49746.1 hypothetical protein C7474_1909 [Microbacterium telephonicum]